MSSCDILKLLILQNTYEIPLKIARILKWVYWATKKSPGSQFNKTRGIESPEHQGTSKQKICIIFGGNIWESIWMSLPGMPSSSSATYWNPNQNRLKASLITNILSKGLTHIEWEIIQILQHQKNPFKAKLGKTNRSKL